MIRKMLIVAAAVAVPVAALQAMTVSAFLQKAEALEKKGVMALMSSDLRVLKNEVQSSAETLKAERLAAERAGRRGAYCPPQNARGLDSRELLAHLRSIPPAQRDRMEVRDALRGLLARKYPCPVSPAGP